MRAGLTVRPLALVLALALAGLVTGCSAAGSSGSSSSSAEGGSADVAAGPAHAAAAPQSKSAPAAPDAAAIVGTQRVRKADITLQVSGLPDAAAKVRAVAAILRGVVSAESTGFGPSPLARSVITIRVPEPRFDDALSRLATVGHETHLSTSSDDVSADIADVNSRVASQAASVARVRVLLNRATSLKDVVLIESELSKREADLESEQAQQRVLTDQADLSTIEVTLMTAPITAAVHKQHRAGFLTGLSNGWHAAGLTTRAVLTVVGAVLPFAAVLIPLAAAAAYLRRHRPGLSRFRRGV